MALFHESWQLCSAKLHCTLLYTHWVFSPMQKVAVLAKSRHQGSWGCVQSILLNPTNTSPHKNRNNRLLTEELAVSSF